MAFELYGLKPRNGIPMPDLPTADEDGKAYRVWLDNVKLDNTKGAYIKISFFLWGQIWKFIIEKFDGILSKKEMDHIFYNDPQTIGHDKAMEIAQKLRELDNELSHYEVKEKKRLNNLQDEECDICGGTGKRCEPPEIGPGDIICNRCNGKGVARPIETIFPFRMDVVRNFAEFCEYSGGFLKL